VPECVADVVAPVVSKQLALGSAGLTNAVSNCTKALDWIQCAVEVIGSGLFSLRIYPHHRVAADIGIGVPAAAKADRVGLEVAAERGVVGAEIVVIEPGLLILELPREPDIDRLRAALGEQLAERAVGGLPFNGAARRRGIRDERCNFASLTLLFEVR